MSSPVALQTSAYPVEILLVEIQESKTNPRAHHDEHAHAELTESVRKLGVLQAVVVRRKGDGYELVCGHRRFRAATAAGLEAIPAIIRDLTDVEVLEIQLVENLQRSDIHALDEADGYRRLMATKKYDAAKIAERTGRSVKYVYDRMKLCELIPEAKKLFLAERFTAGHAILLARLSPKDQGRALKEAVFEHERGLFPPRAYSDRDESKKAVSVRELEAWIDRRIRFEAKAADPMLFQATVAAVAQAEEQAEKIVPITHEYALSPDVKGEQKTICCQSWKRADGLENSKPCEHAITGFIAIGYGRGQAFKVCVAKDKCAVHWSADQRAKKKRAGSGSTAAKERARLKREQEKRNAEQAKRDAAREQWKKAVPAILDAAAGKVRTSSTASTGRLGDLIIRALQCWSAAEASRLIPRGRSVDDLVRHAAFLFITEIVTDPWEGPREFPKIAKALGVDLKKILDATAPAAKAKKGDAA